MNLNNFQQRCGILKAQHGNVEQWHWPFVDKYTYSLIMTDWMSGIQPHILSNPDFKNGTVIQAGGNCGVYPLLLSEHFKRVYTFEPDMVNFFCLVNNTQMPNISKFNCALGDRPGNVKVVVRDEKNVGMNAVAATEEIDVPVVTIDSFDFQDVKLIQLDLEGFEPQALIGATKTIMKWKPHLILECAANYDQVWEVLRPLGYVKIKEITRLDSVFVHRPEEMVVTL